MVRYFKDQIELQILPGDRSRNGPHLNVNQRPTLDRTDGFILFLDRTGPVIKLHFNKVDRGPDCRSDLKIFWTVYGPLSYCVPDDSMNPTCI